MKRVLHKLLRALNIDLARKYGLYVVHDTAQSIGSEYLPRGMKHILQDSPSGINNMNSTSVKDRSIPQGKGKKTGTLADVSTFSFHGTKNMTTGEGGAIVTDNDELAERIIILREKGTNKHSFLTDNITRGYYEYVDIGNSYVQSNILGALGITQLKKLDWMNAERAKIAYYYIKELSDVPNIKFPTITEGAKKNWHLFIILVPPEHKYWTMDALRAEGVYSNVHYTPLHRNKFYSHLGTDEDFSGFNEIFWWLAETTNLSFINNRRKKIGSKGC